MIQLVVENVEEDMARRLEKRAHKHGVTMEEELRRILREALDEEPEEEKMSFKEFLMTMPDVGDDSIFERDYSLPSRGTEQNIYVD